MQKHVITDGSSRYTRISKQVARKMFNAPDHRGIYVIAHKMRPGFPFSMGMTIFPKQYADEGIGFDSMVANFCYYNANCHETGLYPAFYLVTDKKQVAA